MSVLSRLTDLPNGHPNQRDDFDRRYLNTYLVHTTKDTQRPIQFVGRDVNRLHFQYTNRDDLIIDGSKPDDTIQIFLPPVGYYNKMGTPFYLYKNPNRQWRRSFCNSIYAVTGQRLEPRDVWGTYAECILQQEYAHLDEILNPLFVNVALSRKYALQAKQHSLPVLLYKQYEIGTVDFSQKEICLLQPALRQEVQDLFKYSGVTKWKLKLTPAV